MTLMIVSSNSLRSYKTLIELSLATTFILVDCISDLLLLACLLCYFSMILTFIRSCFVLDILRKWKDCTLIVFRTKNKVVFLEFSKNTTWFKRILNKGLECNDVPELLLKNEAWFSSSFVQCDSLASAQKNAWCNNQHKCKQNSNVSKTSVHMIPVSPLFKSFPFKDIIDVDKN